MIAVDTNVLVHAHRSETTLHGRAFLWLRYLAEGDAPWAIPLFCLGEFLRVATHRRLFDPPSTIAQAVEAVESLLESPSLRILAPSTAHWPLLRAAVQAGEATGNLVFGAQIAAICREHGVDRLLTEDRDFSRLPFLQTLRLSDQPEA